MTYKEHPEAVPPLLPRLLQATQAIEDERKLAKILLETGEAAPVKVVVGGTTSGGDPRRLRGLPAIGRSVSGATRDTDPLQALLWKERGRRR